MVVNSLRNLTNIRNYENNILIDLFNDFIYGGNRQDSPLAHSARPYWEESEKFQTAHSLDLACPLKIRNDESSGLWKGGREPTQKAQNDGQKWQIGAYALSAGSVFAIL